MKKLNFKKIWNDLGDILEDGIVIHTLSRKQPNKVVSFSDEGIEVITKRSSPESQLVRMKGSDPFSTEFEENS